MGKHKGDRIFRGVRLPKHVNDALVEKAESEGLNLNDFLVNAVAARCGLAEPFPARSHLFETQELTLRQAS